MIGYPLFFAVLLRQVLLSCYNPRVFPSIFRNVFLHSISFSFIYLGINILKTISLLCRRHHIQIRASFITNARHSLPLNIKGSLACHTYFDTRHPFIIVISEDPRHSHPLPSVWQWSCRYML